MNYPFIPPSLESSSAHPQVREIYPLHHHHPSSRHGFIDTTGSDIQSATDDLGYCFRVFQGIHNSLGSDKQSDIIDIGYCFRVFSGIPDSLGLDTLSDIIDLGFCFRAFYGIHDSSGSDIQSDITDLGYCFRVAERLGTGLGTTNAFFIDRTL